MGDRFLIATDLKYLTPTGHGQHSIRINVAPPARVKLGLALSLQSQDYPKFLQKRDWLVTLPVSTC